MQRIRTRGVSSHLLTAALALGVFPVGICQGVSAAVESFLAEPDPSAAEAQLRSILADPGISAVELMKTLPVKPTGAWAASGTYRLPAGPVHLEVHYATPPGHSHQTEALPLVMNISGGVFAQNFNPPSGYIQVWVPKFNPPEFSDEGRDAFLKVARDACHRLNGDPERIWLTGFSWAAHAASDTAVHRPGFVRAIAPIGGGPRRTHFRLLKNLSGTLVRFYCGGRDDPELVWNLREMEKRAPGLKVDARLTIDPDQGHTYPLRGSDSIVTDFAAVPANPPALLASRFSTALWADGVAVESPVLRFDKIDESRVKVRPRVPVPATASHDEQRRLTIKAYEKAVVTLRSQASVEVKSGALRIEVASEGVLEASLFLRAPHVAPGTKLTVVTGARKHFEGEATASAETILREVRRTGERLRPTFQIIPVKLR